jgi:hypothetical protein
MAIPAHMKDIYRYLRNEIFWIHARWLVFCQVFRKNTKRIDLLNETASTFFLMTYDAFLNDIILALCRLTDPPEIQKKKTTIGNMSLEQLILKLDTATDSSLIDELKRIHDRLIAKCKYIRDRRHKLIAHRDLDVALKLINKPKGTKRSEIDDILKDVREFMNVFQNHFEGDITYYENWHHNSNGDTLIDTLKKAVEYHELEKDGSMNWLRLHQGKYKDA